MFNMRNQLDKIIITAMDRFVWFVLLVVISHLVTEFTRVTGNTRGPRQDLVTVNDSLMQPIRVQNLVLYPGQEYGLYEQQNQQYYNDSNHYSTFVNNNNNTNNNFLSSLFNQFIHYNNGNGSEQQQLQKPTSNSVSSNNLLNMPSEINPAKFFSIRPIIDSIFEIPISTLRAVNSLMRSLTGGYRQPQQQSQQEQQPQDSDQLHEQLLPQHQPPIKYLAYPFYPSSYYPYDYGMQRSAPAVQPKSQYEILKGKQSLTEAAMKSTVATSTAITNSSLSGRRQR